MNSMLALPMTPPRSDTATPEAERAFERNTHTSISISTAFFPNSRLHPDASDITLLSADFVFFYVHSSVLAAASNNSFNGLLPPSACAPTPPQTPPAENIIISVPEASPVLNILLHTLYSISCAHYSPDLNVLIAAVNALQTYAIPSHTVLVRNTPLFDLLLSRASTSPLEVYALAASHGLEELAVAVSPHLLSISLASLSDELALHIGPVYLKRLFFLHLGRVEAIKRLVLNPPNAHAPTAECSLAEQKKVTRAWALATAYLVWDARPDLPCSSLESSLTPLTDHLWCDLCRQGMHDRIKEVLSQWSKVKRTI